MKKFILFAAVLGACVFTSCKDEDVALNQTKVEAAVIDQSQLNDAKKAVLDDAVSGYTYQGTNADNEKYYKSADGNTTVTVKKDGTIETKTTDAEGNETTTTTSYDYTYEVNGQKFNDVDSLMNAIKGLPAGTAVEVVTTLTETTKDDKGNVVSTKQKQAKSKINIPTTENVSTQNITVPTSVNSDKTQNVAVKVVTDPRHSGGKGGK